MPSTKKPTPDADSTRYELDWDQTRFSTPKAPPVPKVAAPKVPTKAARKAVGATKSPRTDADPTPASRRARRAALVARKAAYREALLAWAIGAKVSNPDALRAIGLRAAHKRPSGLGDDTGGMDSALAAMEAAAQRELPTQGPLISGMIVQYHAGTRVWQERKKRREEAAKASAKAEAEARDRALALGNVKGRSKRIATEAPDRVRDLHRLALDLAEKAVRRAWRTARGRAHSLFFALGVAETWKGETLQNRFSPDVIGPANRTKSERVRVYVDTNAIPLWKAGDAHHFGDNTIILGIDRSDPTKCFVAAQSGPYTYNVTRRKTP